MQSRKPFLRPGTTRNCTALGDLEKKKKTATKIDESFTETQFLPAIARLPESQLESTYIQTYTYTYIHTYIHT
jgi:hypothetical protein